MIPADKLILFDSSLPAPAPSTYGGNFEDEGINFMVYLPYTASE